MNPENVNSILINFVFSILIYVESILIGVIVCNASFKYFSHIVAVNYIAEGNQRKPPNCH